LFLNGQSPYQEVLGGDPAQQRLAIWHYMALASELPAPEGTGADAAGDLALQGAHVVRTFLPGLSPRGMGVRFSEGVRLAYDAQNCRLAYAWSGDFLDMTGAWANRGGRPAAPLGPIFWNAPQGFPWDVTL